VKLYTFGSSFPALAARIRDNLLTLNGFSQGITGSFLAVKRAKYLSKYKKQIWCGERHYCMCI
jgi:hypothetical protein